MFEGDRYTDAGAARLSDSWSAGKGGFG